MKKKILAFVLLSALLLTSCSNQDVQLPTPESMTSGSTSSDEEISSDNSSETETSSPETSSTTSTPPETTSSATTTSQPETTTTTTTPPQTTTTAATTPAPEPAPEEETTVSFSKDSGIYASAFDLTIKSETAGQIYYTLDGSDPTLSDTAVLYNGAIKITDRKNDKNVVSAVDPVLFAGSYNKVNSKRDGFTCEISAPSDKAVDKCTVVRAAVKKSDGTFGVDSSATYFIGTAEEHIKGLKESCNASGMDLAVISISIDYDDLFDSTKGIYVKGDIFDNALKEYLSQNRLRDPETARSLDANYKQKGREWEREVALSMFEFSADGTATEVINQNCGIRVQGNYSRSDVQKGLRLYARDEYSKKNFKYAVFGEDYLNDSGEVMDKFKTLVLRAGGNCAFLAKFNDTYWQSLVEEMDIETKKSRPCVVYINGEYWGAYVLEEDYTDDYLEDIHGVNKDDVVIYKGDAEAPEIGYKLDEGDIPEGEEEDYYFAELKNFFKTHKNLKNQKDYDAFIKLVDPDSVRDYFAVECWINNKWDWPGKNWSMWKTINTDSSNEYADGRWRFLLYDVEFGGISGSGDARTNTIKEDNYKPNGLLDMDTENPAVLCFAYLMTNDAFREDFCNTLTGLSDGYLEKNRAKAQLQYFKDTYSPLFDQFFARYKGTGDKNDALNGGYGSVKCIDDFLSSRYKYIKAQTNYCEKILG